MVRLMRAVYSRIHEQQPRDLIRRSMNQLLAVALAMGFAEAGLAQRQEPREPTPPPALGAILREVPEVH
jgi:hypothetical protein